MGSEKNFFSPNRNMWSLLNSAGTLTGTMSNKTKIELYGNEHALQVDLLDKYIKNQLILYCMVEDA